MRLALAALVCSAVAAAQAPPARSRIEGKVVSPVGVSLSKATLRLQAMKPASDSEPRPSGSGASQSYTGETDASGNYVFENIEPGSYSLFAERSGYVRGLYIGSASNPQGLFTLGAGQAMDGIAIELTPQGIIAGKVTDRDGDPMERARVTAYRRTYVAGHWQFQFVQGTPAALDGSFQIGGLT